MWKLLFLAATAGAIGGCMDGEVAPSDVRVGDVSRGRSLIQHFGCGSCHAIPDVDNARGKVGPPLEGIARRAYLGGVLPNTPNNMIVWIQDPQSIDPRTAMPPLGVSSVDARDLA